MSVRHHNDTSDQSMDEGTEVLKHLADEIQSERDSGASHFAVPADEPDYVEDPATVERSSSDENRGDDGPIVPIRPV